MVTFRIPIFCDSLISSSLELWLLDYWFFDWIVTNLLWRMYYVFGITSKNVRLSGQGKPFLIDWSFNLFYGNWKQWKEEEWAKGTSPSFSIFTPNNFGKMSIFCNLNTQVLCVCLLLFSSPLQHKNYLPFNVSYLPFSMRVIPPSTLAWVVSCEGNNLAVSWEMILINQVLRHTAL